MSLIEVGKIVNTRGLKGELKIQSYLDDSESFLEFEYIYIENEKFTFKNKRIFKNNILVILDGVDSIEKAQVFKNKIAYINEEDMPALSEGEYYIKDLIGLNVKTTDGEFLGAVCEVLKTGSNDVYTVSDSNGKKIYIPAIKDVVMDIDLIKREITVKLIEGLI